MRKGRTLQAKSIADVVSGGGSEGFRSIEIYEHQFPINMKAMERQHTQPAIDLPEVEQFSSTFDWKFN